MKILFLSTWFPYPLIQGSKLRAYYLLKALGEKHDVTLLSFQDQQVQPEWIQQLRPYAQHIEIIPRNPFDQNGLRKKYGWLSTKPSSVITAFEPLMMERVRQVIHSWKPDRVVALTFITAPYACAGGDIPTILDIDNLTYKMLQEEHRSTEDWIKRPRRYLAWKKMEHYEKQLYQQFNTCLTVSEKDKSEVLRISPDLQGKIFTIPNGVDLRYNFCHDCPTDPDTLIFNGSVTYFPNYDGVEYFVQHILGEIQKSIPDVCLRVTGRTDGVDLESFKSLKAVQFTGHLEDIRPVVSSSQVCVVPLRFGGGTRLKILEAMALGTPVVSTSKGAEGLEVEHGIHLMIADTPEAFAQHVVRLLCDKGLRECIRENAYRYICSHHDWERIGKEFLTCVEHCQ